MYPTALRRCIGVPRSEGAQASAPDSMSFASEGAPPPKTDAGRAMSMTPTNEIPRRWTCYKAVCGQSVQAYRTRSLLRGNSSRP